MWLPKTLLCRPHAYEPTSQEKYAEDLADWMETALDELRSQQLQLRTTHTPPRRTFVQNMATSLDEDQTLRKRTEP